MTNPSAMATVRTELPKGAGEAAPSRTNKTLEGQMAAPQAIPPPKKTKDKKIWSCHSCRRRKLKCDRSDPCGACRARGEGQSCTWEEGQRPEKSHRDSLEKLPDLISKLMEEVQELKTSNTELVRMNRYKDSTAPLQRSSIPYSSTSDVNPLFGGFGSSSLYQNSCQRRLEMARTVALLPESHVLSSLISQFLYCSAPIVGFIDVTQLISDVEEVEQVRNGKENTDSPYSPDQFNIKVSLILACASLAAVNLDTIKAHELGVPRNDIDALARDLWRKARSLIMYLDFDPFTTEFETSISASTGGQSLSTDSYANLQQPGSSSTFDPALLLKVVTIKILLLLAAQSFAGPSEYLKLHLDTISSAVEASLNSSWDEDMPFEEREQRWQLWSFLCILDWTSPGVYHSGSYFIRSDMHGDPPSKVSGLPENDNASHLMHTEHMERLSQNRYFIEYSLALAKVSRRAEDCISRPGPISPTQAAELCSELDALDHKLSFYQLLSGYSVRRGETNDTNDALHQSTSGGVVNGMETKHNLHEHRCSLESALMIQNSHLNLELGLIRFKLFRHEAFHLMRDANNPGPLRMMCMDACMDACILVLSQCRNIGQQGVAPHTGNRGGIEGLRSTESDQSSCTGESHHAFPGNFRLVIQPTSSAALVGQVLLHASQSADGLGLLIPSSSDKHAISPSSSKQVSGSRGISSSSPGGTITPVTNDFPYPLAERSLDAFAPPYHHHLVNGTGAASWTGASKLGRDKINVLRWHVNNVIKELEILQSTSPLARYKLALHRQCM